MKLFRIAAIICLATTHLSAATLVPPPPGERPWTPIPVQGCCKTCSKGKACGDSCIARDRRCSKGRGCACDG